MDLPVLFLVYKRFDLVNSNIDFLLNNSNRDIYVSIDLAEEEIWKDRQQEFIDQLSAKEKQRCININISGTHLGLKNAVMSGVSWFFDNCQSGVILEDDLEVDPSFYSFCEKLIAITQSRSDILLISGTRPHVFEPDWPTQGTCLESTYPLVWGWATTSEKWRTMKMCIREIHVSRKRESKLSVRSFWAAGRYSVRKNLLDSWALPLADAMHHRDYRCVIPPKNLITNVGFDVHATHTETASDNLQVTRESLRVDQTFTLDASRVESVDRSLETQVFRISRKHIFAYPKVLIATNIRIANFGKSFLQKKNSPVR